MSINANLIIIQEQDIFVWSLSVQTFVKRVVISTFVFDK